MLAFKKLISLVLLVFICFQSFGAEVSETLQKACTVQQLKEHKGIKGHSFTDQDFDGYCKCETDYVLENASEAQLGLINKKLNDNPQWLKHLKAKALSNCVKQEPKKTT